MIDAGPLGWNRRNRLVLAAAVFYIVTVSAGAWLLAQVGQGSPWRFPIVLLPLAGAFTLVFAAVRATMKGDEMEQRAAGHAAVATLVFIASAAIAWGILESFLGLPRISALWWGVGSVGLWGTVTAVVWYRYQ